LAMLVKSCANPGQLCWQRVVSSLAIRTDRDFVDADGLRPGYAGTLELFGHVLLVQRFDRVPVQLEFSGYITHRRLSAAASDVPCKPLGVERIVSQEVEVLGLHRAACSAVEPASLDAQPDPRIAARQVTHPSSLAIVPARLRLPAAPADCFFPRRTSETTRAFGSPNTPLIVACGRKPGNR
jgi:hypothetical protein